MKKMRLVLILWLGTLTAVMAMDGLTPVATNVWTAPNRKLIAPTNRVLRPKLQMTGVKAKPSMLKLNGKDRFISLHPTPTPGHSKVTRVVPNLSNPAFQPTPVNSSRAISIKGPPKVPYPSLYQDH
jgi:hypothetical protein